MPFKSKAQARACYARKDPRWNCAEWSKKTDWKHLPEYSTPEKKRSSLKKRNSFKKRKSTQKKRNSSKKRKSTQKKKHITRK